MKLGSTDINQLYLGSTEIKQAYLGAALVFDTTTPAPASTLSLADAAYNDVNLDISTNAGGIQSMYIAHDGLTLYVLDLTTDSVQQYSMSVANDLSTATYASKSVSIGSQETVAFGIHFNPSLTKMYICGNTDAVYQYSLSVAGDISTASYDSVSLDVSAQGGLPQDLHINDAGTRLYIIDNGEHAIFQYTLSTPWDLSTASYDSKSFDYSGTFTGGENALVMDSTETTFLLASVDVNRTIYQFSMSSSGDITTASYDSVSYQAAEAESTGSINAIGLAYDTSKIYIGTNYLDLIYEIDL